MKAAILEAIDRPLRVADVELDEPREGEVEIRIAACGICRSDLSLIHGVIQAPLPIVLGHEAAGVVERVGPGVAGLVPGDHVIAMLTPQCGRCDLCLEEKPFLCAAMLHTLKNCTMLDGTTRIRHAGRAVHSLCAVGAFAERAVVPAGELVKVDRDLPLDVVCLIGCGVTTGVGAALNTANVKPGTTVAVLGCGGVGLSILQGARIAGATTIVAIDPVASRRALAAELGATHLVDPAEGDAVRAVKKIVRSGVHYAFEAIGRSDTLVQAFAMIRPTGLAVSVGVTSADEVIPIRAGGLQQQKALIGSAYGSVVPARDVPRFLDLYRRGELRLEPMITNRIRLDDVNDALEAMTRGEGARSVITFDPPAAERA